VQPKPGATGSACGRASVWGVGFKVLGFGVVLSSDTVCIMLAMLCYLECGVWGVGFGPWGFRVERFRFFWGLYSRVVIGKLCSFLVFSLHSQTSKTLHSYYQNNVREHPETSTRYTLKPQHGITSGFRVRESATSSSRSQQVVP